MPACHRCFEWGLHAPGCKGKSAPIVNEISNPSENTSWCAGTSLIDRPALHACVPTSPAFDNGSEQLPRRYAQAKTVQDLLTRGWNSKTVPCRQSTSQQVTLHRASCHTPRSNTLHQRTAPPRGLSAQVLMGAKRKPNGVPSAAETPLTGTRDAGACPAQQAGRQAWLRGRTRANALKGASGNSGLQFSDFGRVARPAAARRSSPYDRATHQHAPERHTSVWSSDAPARAMPPPAQQPAGAAAAAAGLTAARAPRAPTR